MSRGNACAIASRSASASGNADHRRRGGRRRQCTRIISGSGPFSERSDIREQLVALYFRWRNALCDLSGKERRHRSGPSRKQMLISFFRSCNLLWNLSRRGRRRG
ncbi:MAG: hypothetical protein KKD68_05900, partial [Proteobacteria bacterium]|nr:hypothetical protein [Pseudomonadota bacterium]